MPFDFKNKRVLITGASGLIGSQVARRLLMMGCSVCAYVRDSRKARALGQMGAEIVVGDILDHGLLKHALSDCQVVFHFAAVLNDYRPKSYYHRINVEATLALAELALNHGVERFIHASTCAVYGLNRSGQVNETTSYRESNDLYADTKVEAENAIHRMAAERGLPAIILQPTQVYGPEDRAWTLRPIELIRTGRMLYGMGRKYIIQPIFIDDMAEGALFAACNGRVGESYLFCGPEAVTMKAYFEHYARMLNSRAGLGVPRWLGLTLAALEETRAELTNRPPVLTRHEVRYVLQKATFSGRKAKQELNFVPKIRLEEGMARVRQWLESR